MDDDQFEKRHDITRQFFDGVQPIGRAREVTDIAAAVAWLASDELSWMTGQAHVVDGGLTAGVPFRQRLRSQFKG